MAHTNTVLSQMLKMIPRHEFESLALAVDGKRRSNALTRWSQFVALTVGQIGKRSSLRDIENTFKTQSHHRYHLGVQNISKSSLRRANEQLDFDFYSQLFSKLYQRCLNKAPKHQLPFKQKLFSIDGSLFDVSMKLFPEANYNTMKAAFKLHLGLDHDGLIPCFAHITEGKVSENEVARKLNVPKGSVVVFDKGYNNYEWHKNLTDKGINWVTRIRGNAVYRIIESRDIDFTSGVTSDDTIKFTSKASRKKNLYPIRRIAYVDQESGQKYIFTTNNFDWDAQTVADIYKQRWQVELFFKWIKQNLKLKSFLGNSKNAVITQILSALCVYLLTAFMKFECKFKLSMQQIVRLLDINLFIKRNMKELLNFKDLIKTEPPPQYCFELARR